MSQLVSGVYLVRCVPTGKVYVGSSVNIKKRWSRHRRQLTKGKHVNRYLQAAWNKHGCAAFAWEVIEQAEPDRLIEREQHFIDSLQSNKEDYGFNLRRFAHSNLGMKKPLTIQNREGITLAMRRLHSTPERLQVKQARLQAKEQRRINRQEEKRLKREEKDWKRSVNRCIAYAKFLARALSLETQAKRTAGVRKARESGKYNYSPKARERMAQGGRKGKGKKKPRRKTHTPSTQESLGDLKFD